MLRHIERRAWSRAPPLRRPRGGPLRSALVLHEMEGLSDQEVAVSFEPSGDRLVCGLAVAELLDQVSAGRADQRDTHQEGCPHCQAALAEYDRLWATVREVADTEVRAPDSVLEEAIRLIRGVVADPTYGSLPSPTGATRISARIVVVTARETAQDIAGVRIVLSKLVAPGVTPVSGPTAGGTGRHPDAGQTANPRQEELRVVAGVAGRSTAIGITLAADYGTDLVDLGERIRAEVATRVRELTGLEPVGVTVHIDDVFD